MRRSVDQFASDRRPGLGRATARGLALAALAAIRAGAGDGDQPELASPSEMPIVSKPSTPAPAPSTAKPPASAPRSRAMLALPGMTTPNARPSPPVEPPRPASASASAPAAGGLTLDAPLEMRPMPEPLPAPPASNASRPSSRPLVLESSTMDELPPPGGATSRPTNPSKTPTTPPQSVQPPARRPRLFGFLGGAPASKPTTPGRAVVAADPVRDDPASDPALKRRIERQAREVVGNRARSVEVKLDGKDAVVQVSGAKMFQKRALRKQLEGIPALTGLRSTIEIGD